MPIERKNRTTKPSEAEFEAMVDDEVAQAMKASGLTEDNANRPASLKMLLRAQAVLMLGVKQKLSNGLKSEDISMSNQSGDKLLSLQEAFDAGFDAVKGYVDRSFESFEETLQKIVTRLEQVESGGIKYCGVHQRAVDYRRGDVVTCSGCAWIALTAVPAGTVPGKSPEHWQLMVVAGRDGKDGKDAA